MKRIKGIGRRELQRRVRREIEIEVQEKDSREEEGKDEIRRGR